MGEGPWRNELAYPLAISLLGLAFYSAFLFRYPLAYGYDGAYYLVQVRQIARSGHLRHGDPPLAFYLFYALSVLLGDYTLGLKVGAILAASLLAFPAYYFLRDAFGDRRPAFIGTLLAVFSYQVLRLSCDLLKNLVGSLFFTSSALTFHLGLRGKGRGLRALLASSAFLILAGLTHVLAFFTTLAFMLIYASLSVLTGGLRPREALRPLALVLSAPLGLVALGLALKPEFFSDVLKLGYFLVDLFSLRGLGFPVEPWPMIYILFALSCYTAHRAYRRPVGPRALAISISILGAIITAPIVPSDWLWRISLMGFLPYSFLTLELTNKGLRKRLLALLMAIMLAHTVAGFIIMGPSISQAEYEDLKAMSPLVPKGSVVFVPDTPSPLAQHLGFTVYGPRLLYWAEYILDCDCKRWLGPDLFRRYEHVLALLPVGLKIPGVRMVLIYEGEELALYEVLTPPPELIRYPW